MKVTTILSGAVALSMLCACGSIKSTQIFGIPPDSPDNYVLQDLQAGERPYFSATISRGRVDTIRNVWLNLRIGSLQR